MEFQLSYFKSWKMMLWKCCTQYASKFGKPSSGHRTKVRKAMPKNAQTTAQLHSSRTLVKWCLKFSKPGFSNTWTVNFQMFKLDLEKAEEPEIKLPTSTGSSKKQQSSRKTSISAWLCGSQQTEIFWKRWVYQTTWPASWDICMQVRKQQLELDMEQQIGSE